MLSSAWVPTPGRSQWPVPMPSSSLPLTSDPLGIVHNASNKHVNKGIYCRTIPTPTTVLSPSPTQQPTFFSTSNPYSRFISSARTRTFPIAHARVNILFDLGSYSRTISTALIRAFTIAHKAANNLFDSGSLSLAINTAIPMAFPII